MISLPQHTPNASSGPQDQLTTAANPTATSASAPPPQQHQGQQLPLHHPRLTIQYCTQCKWMLRAAYFAQELLSTFSTQLGEVALQPATGGVFTVTLYHRRGVMGEEEEEEAEGNGQGQGQGQADAITETVLWDRKRDGGFPEVKVLKSLVRNVVDPGRDLGHTDRALRKAREQQQQQQQEETQEKEKCEDCQ